MDTNIKDELLNDFKSLVSSINFKSYNPNSPEFINALFIGLMYRVMNDISEDSISEMKLENHDDISEEINGAKKYLSRYLENNDLQYKTMAEDEIKHANMLIKKANSKLPTGEEKQLLNNYENQIQQLINLI